MTEHALGPDGDDWPTVVSTGDRITVRLAENPTSGYRWTVDEVDEAVLAPESSSFTPSPASVPGAGGWRTFHFAALGAGTTILRLATRRPGAPPPAGKTFTATVRVIDHIAGAEYNARR